MTGSPSQVIITQLEGVNRSDFKIQNGTDFAMSETYESSVEGFRQLFAGQTDAWGLVEGKSNKEQVTLDHYRSHQRISSEDRYHHQTR